MRKTLLFAALLSVAAAAGADQAPSWLTEVASRQVPDYDKDVPAVVLFKERRITVDQEGGVLTAERVAVRILNREGKQEAVARAMYRTDTGKVRELKAWLLYPSGSVKQFTKKDVADVSLAPDDAYNESRIRMILGQGSADPGSVFGFESLVSDNSIFTQFAYTFQDRLPTLTSRFVLTLPPGWRAEAATFNHDELAPDQSGSTYTWSLDHLAPIVDEPSRPPISSIAPRIAVSYFPSGTAVSATGPTFHTWADVAVWLASLHAPQGDADEAIRERVRALTGSAGTPFERARAIGDYVQKIRYISIQTGVGRGGGYRPHAASEVFRNSYGDCKDKANLLRTMLREAGIEAYPVVVYSGDRDYVKSEWPSPQQFNHAIVAVKLETQLELPAVSQSSEFGSLLFFDPTDEFTQIGTLPEYLQGSLGLIVSADGRELTPLPVAPPAANRLARSVHVKMTPAGDIEADVREECFGDSASHNRSLFRSLSEADYRKMIERWVTDGANAAAVGDIVVDDPSDGAFSLKLSLSAPRYARSMRGMLLMFRPVIVSRRDSSAFLEEERSYPIVLDAHSYAETTTYELPPGFAVDEHPPPMQLSTDFGEYKVAVETRDGKLTFVRELEVKSTVVPTEDYQEVYKFYNTIRGLENTPVVLVRN